MAFIALIKHETAVMVDGEKRNFTMAAGCVGLFVAFETEELAAEYYGVDKSKIQFVEIEILKKEDRNGNA